MTPLEKLTQITNEYHVYDIAKDLLNQPKFETWSGSSKNHQHHYGKGGLLQHTLEVVELCIRINEYYGNPVNTSHLILAALYHDAGKIYDYTPVNEEMTEWTKTTHKRRIHHISRSAIMWSKASENSGLSEEVIDDILHSILSHHGLREWGSPVYPSSKMAWILHLCDGMSARVNDCEKFDRF